MNSAYIHKEKNMSEKSLMIPTATAISLQKNKVFIWRTLAFVREMFSGIWSRKPKIKALSKKPENGKPIYSNDVLRIHAEHKLRAGRVIEALNELKKLDAISTDMVKDTARKLLNDLRFISDRTDARKVASNLFSCYEFLSDTNGLLSLSEIIVAKNLDELSLKCIEKAFEIKKSSEQ